MSKNVIGNRNRKKTHYPVNESTNIRISTNNDTMNKTIGLIAVTAVAILLTTATAIAQGVFVKSNHHLTTGYL